MKELKPCPFCESKESEWQDHPSHCYLFMITEQVESGCARHCKEAVEAAWNTRTPAAMDEKPKLSTMVISCDEVLNNECCGVLEATGNMAELKCNECGKMYVVKSSEKCVWKNDPEDYAYITSCERRCTWAIIEYKFCPFCSKEIEEVKP